MDEKSPRKTHSGGIHLYGRLYRKSHRILPSYPFGPGVPVAAGVAAGAAGVGVEVTIPFRSARLVVGFPDFEAVIMAAMSENEAVPLLMA